MGNESKKFEGSSSTQGGLYDVLLTLKDNIFKTLNVCTFAIVQKVNKDGTINVTPFPIQTNETTKNITCLSSMIPYISKENDNTNIQWIDLNTILSKGDVVLVIFTNRNSIQNFNQSKKNQKLTKLYKETGLHFETYGVVINVCYKKS